MGHPCFRAVMIGPPAHSHSAGRLLSSADGSPAILLILDIQATMRTASAHVLRYTTQAAAPNPFFDKSDNTSVSRSTAATVNKEPIMRASMLMPGYCVYSLERNRINHTQKANKNAQNHQNNIMGSLSNAHCLYNQRYIGQMVPAEVKTSTYARKLPVKFELRSA